MTIGPPSQCLYCVRFRLPLDGYPERTCDAFPDGIPPEIWTNNADHREPYEGDHGLRWTSGSEDIEYPDWALATTGSDDDQ